MPAANHLLSEPPPPMRAFLGHCGTCDRCGAFAFLWVDVPRVLDYGVPDMPPVETEMVGEQLCDGCELKRRREDP